MYTSTDLSLYVGQVVEQDCPGCWFVEEFNLQPPTDVLIVVSNAFDSCIECQNIYWILEDCDGVEDPIITTTDLSLYNNQVITLEWCPTICWEVSSTREHNNATIIILKETFNQEDMDDSIAEPMVKPEPTIKPNTVPTTKPNVAPSRKNKPFLPMPNVQPDPKAKG